MKNVILNERQVFFFELGRFVNQFSTSESLVFLFLADLLKMNKDECNAITSGAKIEVCCSYIKRVYEARSTEIPNDVSQCLDQVSIINKLRNDLLHRGATSDFTVSNEVRALPGRVESYKIDLQMLRNATQDLSKITMTLNLVINPVDDISPERERMKEVANGPWRYKPPSPINNHQKNRGNHQAPKPPREPSRG
jgi:hypothetical protein